MNTKTAYASCSLSSSAEVPPDGIWPRSLAAERLAATLRDRRTARRRADAAPKADAPAPGAGGETGTAAAARAVRALMEADDPAAHLAGPLSRSAQGQALSNVILDLKRAYGAPIGYGTARGGHLIQFVDASVVVHVLADEGGAVHALVVEPPRAVGRTITEIAERLAEAVGEDGALLVTVGERDLVGSRSDAIGPIGSAGDLVILLAYEDAVASGALARDRILPVNDDPFPEAGGVLSTLPAGTPVTAEMLAALMILHRDAGAAAELIELVGRRALRHLSPRNAGLADGLAGESGAGAMDKALRSGRSRLLPWEESRFAAPESAEPERGSANAPWMLSARELCELVHSVGAAPSLAALGGRQGAVRRFRFDDPSGRVTLASGCVPSGHPVSAALVRPSGADTRAELLLEVLLHRLSATRAASGEARAA